MFETGIGARVDFLREILGPMPKKRYQDPALEIRQDVSRPYWFVRYSVVERTADGPKNRRRVKIFGYCDDVVPKKAKQARADFLNTLNDGRFVAQSQVLFRELAKKYLAVRLDLLGSAARARYRLQIENHLLPAFGNMRLAEIDRETVEQWLAAKAEPVRTATGKEKPGLGWWSRTDLKGVLSAIFRAAIDWKIWDGANPCQGVKIGRKIPVRAKKILTREQLQGLLAQVDPELRFMLMIGFATGLRVSEILGLKWGDVDLSGGTIQVQRRFHRGDVDEPKTENSRRTRELGPLLAEFQARYPGPAVDRFIFAEGQLPPDDRDIQRERLRPAAKRAGCYFPGFGFHTFRRMNITLRQTIGGALPMEAQKMAGHGSLDTTMIYFVTEAEREREQVGKMMDWLYQAPGGVKQ